MFSRFTVFLYYLATLSSWRPERSGFHYDIICIIFSFCHHDSTLFYALKFPDTHKNTHILRQERTLRTKQDGGERQTEAGGWRAEGVGKDPWVIIIPSYPVSCWTAESLGCDVRKKSAFFLLSEQKKCLSSCRVWMVFTSCSVFCVCVEQNVSFKWVWVRSLSPLCSRARFSPPGECHQLQLELLRWLSCSQLGSLQRRGGALHNHMCTMSHMSSNCSVVWKFERWRWGGL